MTSRTTIGSKKSLFHAALLALGTFLLGACEVADNAVGKAMRQRVAEGMSNAFLDGLPDGLHVFVCGAGSPIPDPKRSGPCVAVIAGERLYLVDVGSGGVRNLAPAGIQPGRVDAVLLTHFHSDHIDGLGEIGMQRWAGGHREAPLPVYGPDGVDEVVAGFNAAYRQDVGYRIAHHGRDTVPPSGAGLLAKAFAAPDDGSAVTVIDDRGLKVTAFAVDHSPVEPAVGYRFDYRGRSVLVSGDTKKSPVVLRHAGGVDLLLHEALSPSLVAVMTQGARDAGVEHMVKITEDIVDYHSTPVQAAEIADAAGARQLVLYHIVPALPFDYLERMFLEGVAEAYSGPVVLSRDGDFFSLPAGKTDIAHENLL